MAAQQSPSGSHLLINTFGQAALYYMGNEIANTGAVTTHPIGTLDFKFLVRVNHNKSFDIQWKDGVTFNVNVESAQKICQVQVRAGEMLIPPWYRVKDNTLQQTFSTRQSADFAADAHFRVRIFGLNVFRRVDVRYLQGSWVTMVLHNNQLMKVGLNGSRELAILQEACAEIIRKVHAQPTNVDARTLGLSAEPIAKRQDVDCLSVCSMASSSSQAKSKLKPIAVQEANANTPTVSESTEPLAENANEVMPNLVMASGIDKIREKYMKELEMALAILKKPMEKKPESNEEDWAEEVLAQFWNMAQQGKM